LLRALQKKETVAVLQHISDGHSAARVFLAVQLLPGTRFGSRDAYAWLRVWTVFGKYGMMM